MGSSLANEDMDDVLMLQVKASVKNAGYPADDPHAPMVADETHCYPEYPWLVKRLDGFGDVCYKHHDSRGEDDHSVNGMVVCPEGCFWSACGCLESTTREPCGLTITLTDADCPIFFQIHQVDNPVLNWNCRAAHGVGYKDCTTAWSFTSPGLIAPRGCKPWQHYNLMHGHWWNRRPFLVMGNDDTRACNVDLVNPLEAFRAGGAVDGAARLAARAHWVLVGTGTHGVQAQVEVGLYSENGATVTTEQTASFEAGLALGATVEVTNEVGIDAGVVSASSSMSFGLSVETTFSQQMSEAVAESVEEVAGQSSSQVMAFECPDVTTFDNGGTSRNSNSSALEQLFQWEVLSGGVLAKTDHFRCHQVADGTIKYPRYPPRLCGSPEDNPLCQ